MIYVGHCYGLNSLKTCLRTSDIDVNNNRHLIMLSMTTYVYNELKVCDKSSIHYDTPKGHYNTNLTDIKFTA